jgi:hypothetical protein
LVRWEHARLEIRYDFRQWNTTFHEVGGGQRWGTHERFDDVRHLNRAGAAGWQAYDRCVVWIFEPLRMLTVSYSMRREDPSARWEYARLEYRETGLPKEWAAVFHHPGGVRRWHADDPINHLPYLNRAGAAGWQAYDHSVVWISQPLRMLRIAYSMRREDRSARWEYAQLEYRETGSLGTDAFRDFDAVFHHLDGVERWGTDDRFNDLRHLNRAGAAGWQAYDHSVVRYPGGLAVQRVTHSMRRTGPPALWEYARLDYRMLDSRGAWTAMFRGPGGIEPAGTDQRFNDLPHLNRMGAAGWQAYDHSVVWHRYPQIRDVTYSMRRADPAVPWEYARLDYCWVGSSDVWTAVFHHADGIEPWGIDQRFNDLPHLNRAGAVGWQAYDRSTLCISGSSRMLTVIYPMRRIISERQEGSELDGLH